MPAGGLAQQQGSGGAASARRWCSVCAQPPAIYPKPQLTGSGSRLGGTGGAQPPQCSLRLPGAGARTGGAAAAPGTSCCARPGPFYRYYLAPWWAPQKAEGGGGPTDRGQVQLKPQGTAQENRQLDERWLRNRGRILTASEALHLLSGISRRRGPALAAGFHFGTSRAQDGDHVAFYSAWHAGRGARRCPPHSQRQAPTAAVRRRRRCILAQHHGSVRSLPVLWMALFMYCIKPHMVHLTIPSLRHRPHPSCPGGCGPPQAAMRCG